MVASELTANITPHTHNSNVRPIVIFLSNMNPKIANVYCVLNIYFRDTCLMNLKHEQMFLIKSVLVTDIKDKCQY